MTRTQERGVALVMVTVLLVILAGIALALGTFSNAYARRAESQKYSMTASYAAEAGLEAVWHQIRNSDYDGVNNVWLDSNSLPPPDGFPAIVDMPVKNAFVTVMVYKLDNQLYRAESTARLNDQHVTVAQEFRGNHSLASYMFFNQKDLKFGTTTVRGKVHTNGRLQLYYGGAVFYGDVTHAKANKPDYLKGARVSNTTFYAKHEQVDPVDLSIGDITGLGTFAEPSYLIDKRDVKTYVTAMRDMVRIKVVRDGITISDRPLPAPQEGLIFAQGNVYVSGETSVRYTIASLGNVYITGNIRYVDQDGDPAYLLKRHGQDVPGNRTNPGVAWTPENGFNYVSNPDFNPNDNDVPALGIMAKNAIEITKDAPYNLELHAALLSATGKITFNLQEEKGNLRVLGSMASQEAGARYQPDESSDDYKGWGLSGEYIYDDNLGSSPPPFYLLTNRPEEGPRWRMTAEEVTHAVK
ncbi:MAG: pilus assembly PilX N-terminal domain-containing protein [Planctomycetes bacterium]|nr:pilus assembly PilX N-terminal domain-containing protein [Planctomycetota bacterium]